MTEKEFDVIKVLCKLLRTSVAKNLNYLNEKLEVVDGIRFSKDAILPLVGLFDSRNQNKLFELGRAAGVDIENIRAEEYYR